MNQSSFTAAMLAAAFVLFLAARNRLSAYTAVLWGNTAAALPSSSAATPTAATAQAAAPALSAAMDAIGLVGP